MSRIRPGWTRLEAGRYRLDGTDWLVQRCGHPTALWPYHGTSPDGRLLIGRHRKAFRLLIEAQQAVELAVNNPTSYQEIQGFLVTTLEFPC